MRNQLTTRLRKIEEHMGMKDDNTKRKVIVVAPGETKEEAFLREGLDPKNHPGVDIIVVHLMKPGDAVTSLDTTATERKYSALGLPFSNTPKCGSDLTPGWPWRPQNRLFLPR